MSRTLTLSSKGTLLTISCLVLALTLPSLRVDAQDIHYTQFYNALFQVSPAQTGLFDGDTRVQANYRNQWRTVPVAYKTLATAVDKRFRSSNPNQYFSGGLAFNYDQAGYSELNNTQVNLLGSFTRRTSQKTYLTFGGMIGFNQRAFRLSDLTFDSQYDGQGGFNPSTPSGEAFPDLNNNFADASLGVNFRFQAKDTFLLVDRLEQRSKIDVGLGVFHLTQPNQNFLDGVEAPLPIRLTPYVFGTLQLSADLDLVGAFMVQFQSTYRELTYGAAMRWHWSRQPGKQLAVQLGMNFRSHDFGESWSPVFEAHYNSWRVGLSYEVNTSGFQVATGRDSGPELSVRYIFKSVSSSRQGLPFRNCPLI